MRLVRGAETGIPGRSFPPPCLDSASGSATIHHHMTLGDQFKEFLHQETSGAIVLLVATVAAVAVANSPLAAAYDRVPAHQRRPLLRRSRVRAVGAALGRRRADGALLLRRRARDQARGHRRRAVDAARRPAADRRGARRHAGAGRHLPGAERRGRRRGRVGRPDGDRHRVRARRARAARPARPERPEGLPDGARDRRRHRGDPRHRDLLHRRRSTGSGSRSRSSRWRRSSR